MVPKEDSFATDGEACHLLLKKYKAQLLSYLSVTEYGQFCALARTAEIIGERWTLLILRELYLGPRRFSDLKTRLAPIAPGVLNGRLKALQSRGVIVRREVPPPTPATVYELSDAGRALQPALFEMLRWGARYLFPLRDGERFEPEWLRMVLEAYASPAASPTVRLAVAVTGPDGTSEGVAVVRGSAAGTLIQPFAAADATISGSVEALFELMSGRVRVAEAVEAGSVSVEGQIGLAEEFRALFIRPDA